FGAPDEISRRNDFIDEADAIGFLRADHLSRQNELEGATFADQPRQALGYAATRNESPRDFGLTKSRGVYRDPDGAGHRRLATAAECKAIDGRDHRLAEIFDEIEDFLAETAGLFRLRNGNAGELADVCSCDERLVAGPGQDDAAHCRVVARILERRPEVLPRRRIQRVENFWAIDGDVGDAAFLRIK